MTAFIDAFETLTLQLFEYITLMEFRVLPKVFEYMSFNYSPFIFLIRLNFFPSQYVSINFL